MTFMRSLGEPSSACRAEIWRILVCIVSDRLPSAFAICAKAAAPPTFCLFPDDRVDLGGLEASAENLRFELEEDTVSDWGKLVEAIGVGEAGASIPSNSEAGGPSRADSTGVGVAGMLPGGAVLGGTLLGAAAGALLAGVRMLPDT
jgi:hypothetical protein